MRSSNTQANQSSMIVQLQEAGGFELPKAILDAHRRVEKATQLLASEPPVMEALAKEDEIVSRLLESSLSRKDVANIGTEIAEAQAAESAALVSQRILRRVVEHEEQIFATVTRDNAEAVIVKCLRPALAETLTEARTAAQVLRNYGAEPSADQFLASPDQDREAYVRLQHAAQRYAGLRQAQRTLGLLGIRSEFDTAGRFGELKNLFSVWPSVAAGRSAPPWPADQVARLIWLTTSDAQPWMPTPSDQDHAAKDHAERTQARTATALGAVGTA